jgi:phage terminase Nu1 subunit (DNA packaging protein)
MPGRIVIGPDDTMSQTELATLVGTSTRTIREHENVIPRTGPRNSYKVAEAVAAYCEYLRTRAGATAHTSTDEYATARTAKMKADAVRAQVRAAEATRQVIPTHQVERRWAAAARLLRASLLSMASRIGARLNLDQATVSEIKAEVMAALEDLANGGADQSEAQEVRDRLGEIRESQQDDDDDD